MARLRPQFNQVIGRKVFMQAAQDINIGGRLEQAQYQYTLTDSNTDELDHWAPILLADMQKPSILSDVATDLQVASPNLDVVVDRDTAYRLGISLSAARPNALRRIRSARIGNIYTSTNQYKVILEVPPRFQTRRGRAVAASTPGAAARRCRSALSPTSRPRPSRCRSIIRVYSRR